MKAISAPITAGDSPQSFPAVENAAPPWRSPVDAVAFASRAKMLCPGTYMNVLKLIAAMMVSGVSRCVRP